MHETLMQVVAEGHVLAGESSAQAWDRIAPPAPLGDAELAALVERLAAVPVPSTAKREPDKKWAGALAKARACVAEARWTDLFDGGIGAKWLEGSASFCSRPIDAELAQLLERLAVHAAAVEGAELARQNRATRRLLEAFDAEYRRAQRERAAVRFEDLPLRLAGRGGSAARVGLDDVALRLDARIDHLLLDEFQDTSPAQWRVLAPFADELAWDGGGARSFFCVGDAKQSIYGWRSAEPRLLEGLPERLGVEPQSLHVSRRSARVVLEAVNGVFASLGENAVFADRDDDRAAAEALQATFHRHEAHDALLAGSVRVHTTAPADDAEELRRCASEKAVEIVRAIRAQAPRASIAVLLRRHKLAGAIVRGLRAADVSASDEGGNPLCDSEAVQVALSLLHWIDHPADRAACFHVRTSKLAPALGLERDASAAQLGALRRREQAALLDRGLAQRLAELRPAVEAAWGEWEARRFGQLIDLALSWSAQVELRPGEFIQRAREQAVEDPSSAQVKVMTIHAAKGLEFDAIVLPELDFDFVRRPPAFVWRRRGEDPTQDVEAVSRSAGEPLRTLLARAGDRTLEELALSTRLRGLRDELSALYVGMTRARHRVDLVLSPEGANRPALTGAGIVREAFGLGRGPLPASTVVHECAGSDDGWTAARAAKPQPAAESAAASAAPLRFAPSKRPRELERVSPSKLDAAGRIATAELFRNVDAAWLGRGSRFHAWLERVEWLETFAAGDAELRAHAEALGLGGAGLEGDLAELRRRLARPALRALLSRASYAAPEVELWRERRFRQIVGGGAHAQLVSGAFDRVVIEREGGRALRADLLDFKSDRVDEGGLAALSEHYAPQLRAYRAALARITGLEETAVRTRLAFLALDRVVELHG